MRRTRILRRLRWRGPLKPRVNVRSQTSATVFRSNAGWRRLRAIRSGRPENNNDKPVQERDTNDNDGGARGRAANTRR